MRRDVGTNLVNLIRAVDFKKIIQPDLQAPPHQPRPTGSWTADQTLERPGVGGEVHPHS